MVREIGIRYTWNGSREALERLGAANGRADAVWLRSLSIEESIHILEDLCRGIPEVPPRSDMDPPPVVLSRLWRSGGTAAGVS